MFTLGLVLRQPLRCSFIRPTHSSLARVADDLYRKIVIEVQGHDKAVLNSYSKFIAMTADELGLELTSIRTPANRIQRWTILKSAFVHKKHRVQYEAWTHYREYVFERLTGSTASVVLEYFQRNIPEGVAMKVTKYKLEVLPPVITENILERHSGRTAGNVGNDEVDSEEPVLIEDYGNTNNVETVFQPDYEASSNEQSTSDQSYVVSTREHSVSEEGHDDFNGENLMLDEDLENSTSNSEDAMSEFSTTENHVETLPNETLQDLKSEESNLNESSKSPSVQPNSSCSSHEDPKQTNN